VREKNKEKSDFLETPACTQKRTLFTFRKKKSHFIAFIKEEAIDSSEHNKRTQKQRVFFCCYCL